MPLPILLVATGLASCLLLVDHLLHGTTPEKTETPPEAKPEKVKKKRKKKVVVSPVETIAPSVTPEKENVQQQTADTEQLPVA